MLKVQNISFKRNGRIILNNATVSAQPGDIVELRGSNGAGKSTLIKIIAGLINQDEGNILLNDTDISSLAAKERANLIGMVHQDPKVSTVGNLTVEENLALAYLKGRTASFLGALKELQNSELMKTFTTLFSNKDILHQQVKTLSGGQRQLLACVMALAKHPRVLLLDEPIAALDSAAASHLMSFVSSYAREHNIIVIIITHTHEPYDAETLKWHLDNGTVLT